MARDNLSACLAVTLPHEGGYVDHPRDPGGATNMGITFAVLQKWMGKKITKQDVKNLTLATATAIYDRNYWRPVSCDLLPWGVDLAVFDAGVNSGPSRGAKWLQRAVGVKADGVIGNDTLRATGMKHPVETIKAICAYRLGFVRGLSTFSVFGKGWSRRIADIEARGVAMWLRHGAGKSAGETADRLAAEAKAASGKAVDQGKGAATAGAGGAGAGVGDMAAGGTGWLLVVLGVAALVSVLLIVKSRQNAARAAAYDAAMDEQALDEMAGQ